MVVEYGEGGGGWREGKKQTWIYQHLHPPASIQCCHLRESDVIAYANPQLSTFSIDHCQRIPCCQRVGFLESLLPGDIYVKKVDLQKGDKLLNIDF